MTDPEQTSKQEHVKLEKNLEEMCIDACWHLSTKHEIPAEAKEFLKSQDCVDFFEEYFDRKIFDMMGEAKKVPGFYTMECWEKRVRDFYGDTSDMDINKFKERMQGKSKYRVMTLLAQREATINLTEDYNRHTFEK